MRCILCSVCFDDSRVKRWQQQAVPPHNMIVMKMLMLMNFAYTLLVLNYSCVGFMASVIFNAYLYMFLIKLLKNLIFLNPGWALCDYVTGIKPKPARSSPVQWL
ncbi:putative 1-acylglycerophosphocholine O-acyltransferase [Helianthus annuus]|nr:putative 1-acylglycerophosphocholine O-acyltransferase [Helianthus annuus]KAJ0906857.1 putative 1-acylglycerophosphocholine O-acyltransferase [Helianthus annuus]